MARRKRRLTARQRLEALAQEMEPIIQAAFLSAVDDILSNVALARVIERLERGDIEGALSALNIEPMAFREFEEAIRRAYVGGGAATVGGMPALREPDGSRLVLRFDSRSPRAEAFLRDQSGQRITRVADDILLAARQYMTQGMIDGRNPRSVALDIAGRLNRTTGRREGGVIGLTSTQSEYVARARRELASNEPDQLRQYLARSRRDRRFDRTVTVALRDGKAIPNEMIDRMVRKYSDNLLLLRGETIARTEMLTALAEGQKEAYEQAIASGAVNRQDVRKVWRATRDSRTRDSHRHVDSESVGMDERFSNGLLYPHEPGAPASEVVNCRCAIDYRIDFMANLT